MTLQVSCPTTISKLLAHNLQGNILMFFGASGKRWSTETEVQKYKYGSEKKSRLLVSSALLTHYCVCWGLVANGCLPAIWEQDPEFSGYSECLYHDAMVSKWPDPTQDYRWVGQPCELYSPDFFVTVIQMKVVTH